MKKKIESELYLNLFHSCTSKLSNPIDTKNVSLPDIKPNLFCKI